MSLETQRSASARIAAWLAMLAFAGWTHEARAQGPEICPDSFDVGGGFRIPICRNYALETARLQVTRAVVAIHGAERRATETYAAVLAAAEEAGEDSNTLVVAPQFLNQTDPGLPYDALYWTGTAWRFGNRSVNGPRLSSYEVLDAILITIAENGNFPNLATLVVAGHSAGGQFTQRFASASPAEIQISEEPAIPMRYVVMNPGSWLYLDPARWDPDSERFVAPDPEACPGYDDYGYGLHANLNEYMRAVGPDAIRKQFGQRRLAYLLGDQDVCRPDDEQCSTPPGSPPPDGSCAAMLQGGYRFERGSIFYEYVQYFYGPEILTRHSMDIVPGVGHDGTAMFTSSQSLSAIFDYASCSE